MPAVTPAEGTRIDATICPMCGRSMVTGQSPAVRELVEAARAMVSVAQEYYDMECGENGAPAIERVNDAIAAVEREAT